MKMNSVNIQLEIAIFCMKILSRLQIFMNSDNTTAGIDNITLTINTV